MKGSQALKSGGWFGTRELLEERRAAWERYRRWGTEEKGSLSPSAAVASVGFLYALLPPESRRRPVDGSGVVHMHRVLAVLG